MARTSRNNIAKTKNHFSVNGSEDSNCNSFNNRTMFDDFNGFSGFPLNEVHSDKTLRGFDGDWSSAAGRNTKPAKQNRNTSRSGVGRKKSLGGVNPSGARDVGCGDAQCYCVDGSTTGANNIKCSSGNCDACISKACAYACGDRDRVAQTIENKSFPFSGDANFNGFKLR